MKGEKKEEEKEVKKRVCKGGRNRCRRRRAKSEEGRVKTRRER